MRTVCVPSKALRAGSTSSSRSSRARSCGRAVDQLGLDDALEDRVAVARDALEVGRGRVHGVLYPIRRRGGDPGSIPGIHGRQGAFSNFYSFPEKNERTPIGKTLFLALAFVQTSLARQLFLESLVSPRKGSIMKRGVSCRSLAVLGGVLFGSACSHAVGGLDRRSYKGTKYSEGAASCSRRRMQFRCEDGEWKSVGVACSDNPVASRELPVRRRHVPERHGELSGRQPVPLRRRSVGRLSPTSLARWPIRPSGSCPRDGAASSTMRRSPTTLPSASRARRIFAATATGSSSGPSVANPSLVPRSYTGRASRSSREGSAPILPAIGVDTAPRRFSGGTRCRPLHG